MKIETPMKSTKIIGLELRITPSGGRQQETVLIPLDIEVIHPDQNITGRAATFNVTMHTAAGDANIDNTELMYNESMLVDFRMMTPEELGEQLQDIEGERILVLGRTNTSTKQNIPQVQ